MLSWGVPTTRYEALHIIVKKRLMNKIIDRVANKRAAFLLFLSGAFSMTRINIGGKLGISEFVILLCSPIVLARNISVFRKEHLSLFLTLCFFWLINAILADWINATYLPFALKGIANPIMVFVNSMTLYLLLRRNPENLRFLVLGSAISTVISIFFFQNVTNDELAQIGSSLDATSKVVEYKLFWGNMTMAWLGLLVTGWYLQIRQGLSLMLVGFIVVAYALCGGRSATMSFLVSFLLIFIGGNRTQTMGRVKRHILWIVILLFVLGVIFKSAYKYAATHGLMGEMEARKYERQTAGSSGDLASMLVSGRSELFIATGAALDRPLSGHGSHALDNDGYVANFLSKYGSDTDRKLYYEAALNRLHQIPFHSQIATFWMWHGIGGLLFWGYVLFLVVWTLMRGMAVFPPYFGYLALVLPIALWDIFFSPFGARIPECAMFVACLMVRNMSRGMRYPEEGRMVFGGQAAR